MTNIIYDNTNSFTRPICVLNGVPYLATHIRVTGDKNRPVNCWVVAEANGQARYSERPLVGHEDLKNAPFSFDIDACPRPDTCLSGMSYKKFVLDNEPLLSSEKLFGMVSSNIDHFVAFEGSFASQNDMADFLACWIFATYAADIFDTAGYVWPTGEKGSGKTQCLKTLMQMAFLGQTVTSGSSFASLRDEASLGATLGFDDCEGIGRMENEKRELLLAGNTKGAGLTYKIPGSREGLWQTKYLDTYAFKAFTSIRLPDDVLGSRTIMVDLGRTTDVAKTRRKPTNPADWLYDPKMIRDLLWITCARSLGAISEARIAVNGECDIAGRDFDIFQAPLSIAKWMDAGCPGLYLRMAKVMDAYAQIKHVSIMPSLEHLALQAAYDLAGNGTAKPTADIVDQIGAICADRDITDPHLTNAGVQSVGTLLGRCGFEKTKVAGGTKRAWRLSREHVIRRAKSAGLELELEAAETEAKPIGKAPW